MKILFIAPYKPSPIKPRTLNFIKFLRRRNHLVDVITLEETDPIFSTSAIIDEYGIDNLKTIPLNKAVAVAGTILGLLKNKNPLQINYCYSKRLKNIISEKVQSGNYDIVHIENIRAVQYLAENKIKIPIMFDAVDCMSRRYSQFSDKATAILKIIYRMESKRLENYERYAISIARHNIVTTKIERDCLLKILPKAKISIISNGVDFLKFKIRKGISNFEKNKQIVFFGKMDYFPNKLAVLHFTKEIFPQIKQLIPNVKLNIVGANPDKEIKRLALIEGITVKGFVEDIAAEIKRCAVAAFPLVVGTGIQNKLLETIACGVPIVCSALAAKPLNLINGKHAFICDNNEEFALRLATLFSDKWLNLAITKNAYNFVKKKYNWNTKVDELEKLYDNLLHQTNSTTKFSKME